MKKKILYILCILVSGILLISALNFFYTNNKDNSFSRTFSHNKIDLKYELQLPNNKFSFAGKSNNRLTIRALNDPSHFLVIDSSFKIKRFSLKIPSSFRDNVRVTFLNNFSDVTFLNNQFGDLVRFDKNTTSSFHTNGLTFDFLQPISKNQVIVRAKIYKNNEKGRELTKISLLKEGIINEKYLLPKQIDGFFCTDGRLSFDKENSRIFYMYYYRGEFLCLDTNLNLLYKKKTIDTVKTANLKIQFRYIKRSSGGAIPSTTQTTPSDNLVNRYITTDKNSIYILSLLRADNESVSEFKDNRSIDVYSIQNGAYEYSFHIPNYKGKKFSDFQIINNLIVAIFDEYLVAYKFKN